MVTYNAAPHYVNGTNVYGIVGFNVLLKTL